METWYPGAVRTPDFSTGVYAGSPMEPNCLGLHTTEGYSLPGYQGGAVTPHLTFRPDFANKKLVFHQHLPINRSARALENRSGGVQTNTAGVVQIELEGTCDSQYAKSWGTRRASVDYIYWENPPEWAIRDLAKFIVWLDKQAPKFKIEDAPKAVGKGWRAYRINGSTSGGSYGATPNRFTFEEWPNVYGIFGHEHVPENGHGDPGLLPIAAIIASAVAQRDGTTPPPVVVEPPDPTLPPKTYDRMDPASYFAGVIGDHVTWYGQRLVVWSKALGLPSPYAVGPGPEWGSADQRGTREVQLVWWPGSSTLPGGAADGFPGRETLTRLARTPPQRKAITYWSQNEADYDSKPRTGYPNGRGLTTRKSRVRSTAALALKRNPMFIHLQEVDADCVELYDAQFAGFHRMGVGGKGRETWYREGLGLKILGAELRNVAHMLKADTKEFLLTAYELDGYRGAFANFHNENEGTEVQRYQLNDVRKALIAFGDKVDVPRANLVMTGDANRPRAALDLLDWDWKDIGRNAPTSTGQEYASTNGWSGRHLGLRIDVDGVPEAGMPDQYVQDFTIVSDHYGRFCRIFITK